ncbi:MAG: EthD domain-containing protein [Dehalococcoidia bacterium]|nr:EthD domain-containing protein [Dehalococcoidia bacterium]
MVKLISLVYRKKGVSDEEFYSYWRDTHGPLVARLVPFATRYVQNHPLAWPGLTYDADGIVELWFETEDHINKYLEWRATPEAFELKDDEDRFQDFRKTRRFVVHEISFETTGRPWYAGASLPDAPG